MSEEVAVGLEGSDEREGSSEDPLEPAWQKVLAEWGDEQAHKRFLALCAGTDRLPEAGRRYREIREKDPERAEEAKRQIDKLLGMAMKNLEALKTEPQPRSAKTVITLIAIGVSGALVASALWSMLRAM